MIRLAMNSQSMLNSGRHNRFRRNVESSNQGDTAPDSEIAKMLQLIKEGGEKIELSDQYKSAVVVLGISGSGKTTFVQWVTENDDKLISEEEGEDSGEFIILNADKISNNTLQSATIFPELVIDRKTNTAYYDCPGFSDTRGTINNIAQTYLIKKLSGHLTSAKMLFLVSYPSVRAGVDRHNFADLLRHSSSLVKDIDKFNSSMSLVVTKVDKLFHPKTGQLISDEITIKNIANFLRDSKDWFVAKSADPSLSERERSFAERAIKLIDIFLIKDGPNYSRIILFKRPDESGPLNQIESMIEGKEKAQKAIHEGLKFTEMQDDDFGYTVSDKAKNDITVLITEIDKNVWSAVGRIVKKIETHYRDSVSLLSNHLKSLTTLSLTVHTEGLEPKVLLTDLPIAVDVAVSLVTKVNGTTTDRLAEEMKQSISRLAIPELEEELSTISSQGKFYKFLQTVSDAKFAPKPWADLLEPLHFTLADLNVKMNSEVELTAQSLRNRINLLLAEAETEIRQYFNRKSKDLPMAMWSNETESASSSLLSTPEGNTTVTSQKLLEKLEPFTVTISGDFKMILSRISKLGTGLEYLDTISGSSRFNQAVEWQSPFVQLGTYLRELPLWYRFLYDLYSAFSSYGTNETRSATTVTKENFIDFLQQHSLLPAAKDVLSMKATDDRVKDLNELLDITVRSQVSVTCQSDTLFVKGDFVKFSDFINENGEIKTCNGDKAPKQLNIFALRKLFIDRDLIAIGKKLLVAVIAPKLEAVDSRKIDLSGSDCTNQNSDPAAPGRREKQGQDGVSGQPGGSAGSFQGIVGEFIHTKHNLLVIANGGRGCNGQNGGDGGEGKQGKSPSTDPESYFSLWGSCNSGNKGNGWLGKFPYEYDCGDESWWDLASHRANCRFSVRGLEGTEGAAGGTGGAAGNGGRAGKINLFLSQGESDIEISSVVGHSGTNGLGGRFGRRGRTGDDVMVACSKTPSKYLFNIKWTISSVIPHSDEFQPSERTTSSGGITNPLNPESAATIDGPGSIVKDYKRYLRENFNRGFERHTLTSFLHYLNKNYELLKIYRTLDFIDEMLGLEEQFATSNFDIELITSSYESLLDRVAKYAENPREDEESTEYKKTLTYLYTAILSKLHSMRADSGKTMIIDVEKYLDLVDSNIKILSDTKERSSKLKVINKYKKDYKAQIGVKIEEANALIKYQLKPEMDEVNKKIDRNIDKLVDEIKALIDNEKTNREKIIEQKRKLEQQSQAKAAFMVIRAASKVMSCLGPQGAATAEVIGEVSSLAQSLTLGEKLPMKIDKVVLDNAKLLNRTVDSIQKKQVDRLQRRLDQVLKEMITHPELAELAESVEDIKKKNEILKDSQNNGEAIGPGVKKLKDQASEKIFGKQTELEQQEVGTEDLKKVLQKSALIISLADSAFDIYEKYKESAQAVEEITDSLEKVNQNIERLDEYQDKVYAIIAPVIRQTKQDMEEVERSLGTKSQVALDVTKWQVQSSLGDIKAAIGQATKGMDIQDEFTRSIEKLSEVMVTLINIYDRIQDFQEQEKLANYIADISSVTANSISITNQTLGNAVNDLDISIRTNLMLEQYDTAVSSLKQWVFPFAHDYLDDFSAMLPSHLKMKSDDINEVVSDDLNQLADEAVERVTQMKQKVKNYKVSIHESDKFIHLADFDAGPATSPFYVWRNRENRNTISSLLAGVEGEN